MIDPRKQRRYGEKSAGVAHLTCVSVVGIYVVCFVWWVVGGVLYLWCVYVCGVCL